MLPEDIDYSGLPAHMQRAARAWVENGQTPGDFLQAVIRGDLFDAVARADEDNLAALQTWCRWFYNEAPPGCWGSAEKVQAWKARGGLLRQESADRT